MDKVVELEATLQNSITKIMEIMKPSSEMDFSDISVEGLLKAALKNEWETAMLTHEWIKDEADPEFRMSLIRLAGDEAKHFQMIEQYLINLGHQTDYTLFEQKSPLYQFLIKQKDTFSRVLTGPFIREYLAVKRNEEFLDLCQKQEQTEVIKMYETIQDEEFYHHQLGIKFLKKYIKSDEDIFKANQKMDEMLKLVDDIHEMLAMKNGLKCVPGC